MIHSEYSLMIAPVYIKVFCSIFFTINNIMSSQCKLMFLRIILHVHITCLGLFTSTMWKTRPAGRVWPATRFCPAREMFLNYNGNRPAACHRPPLHYVHHRGPKLFTTSSPKDKRHNNVHFFRQRSLERTMDCVICVDTDYH